MRLIHAPRVMSVLVALAAFATARSAHAAEPCPTTQAPPYFSLLHVSGYDATRFNTGKKKIFIGNFNFFGVSTVGAVVVEVNTANASLTTCNLYTVGDLNDNLLGWLPSFYNVMCFGNGEQEVKVVYQAMSGSQFDPKCASSIAMTELNYSGQALMLMALGGPDHVHGGKGYDIIYGGTGNDDIDDGGDAVTVRSPGALYGEEGNDFLYGSRGDRTYLSGGPDNDQLYDSGGTGDELYGDGGNDCCIGDSNHQFSAMDGGAGRNRSDGSSGAINFQGSDPICDTAGIIGCQSTWP